jgi:hypothetical protein
MRIFNFDKTYNVVCNSQGTRYGFRHLATLHKNGFSIGKAKICYYNRTWERFRYESVLLKIINAYFEGKEKDKFLKKIAKINY